MPNSQSHHSLSYPGVFNVIFFFFFQIPFIDASLLIPNQRHFATKTFRHTTERSRPRKKNAVLLGKWPRQPTPASNNEGYTARMYAYGYPTLDRTRAATYNHTHRLNRPYPFQKSKYTMFSLLFFGWLLLHWDGSNFLTVYLKVSVRRYEQ